jgi:hypothetical protein
MCQLCSISAENCHLEVVHAIMSPFLWAVHTNDILRFILMNLRFIVHTNEIYCGKVSLVAFRFNQNSDITNSKSIQPTLKLSRINNEDMKILDYFDRYQI